MVKGGRQGAFVSERHRPVKRHPHPGPRFVEPPREHQPHRERKARTTGVGYLGLQTRVLERDRPLQHSRRRLDGRQRLEPRHGREGKREDVPLTRALRRRQPRSGVLERLVRRTQNEQDLADVALDLRDTSVVTSSLDESALCEVEGSLEALLRAREEQQRIRPRPTGRNVLCKMLEDRCALREVSGVKVKSRRLDLARSEPVSPSRRSQPNGELSELGGHGRSAAGGRLACGLVERHGDLLVWLFGAQREVSRPLLGVADHAGETAMQTPPLGGTDRRVCGRGEQRMAEADLAVRQLDDARLKRLLQRQGVAQDRFGRPRKRRCCGEDLACAQRQHFEALAQDRLERLRDGQGTAGLDPSPSRLQGAHQLERVERVPARGLVDSVERRPCEGHVEPASKEPVQRTDAQRTEPDPDELEIGPAQAERRLTFTFACYTLGQQQADRFLRQSPRHELEHERRWWIQPLHVVYRHEHTSLSGQLPKEAQARSRDRPLVRWRPLLLRQQERRLKGPPLDRG